ncbi:chromosomal replication initiator DnaA [Bauldia sp.]|uniref:chromosomal replication initiator DnaA n=1 Tax=Bauldia sp. TaxID=2575872 RepID=UPI003BAB0AAD
MSRDRSAPPGQLPLELPHETALGRADFIVGESNRNAIALIDCWPTWPERGVLLVGPEGSGKSHLAAIWCAMCGGRHVEAAALDREDAAFDDETTALAVENLDRIPVDEAALFHLVNRAIERRRALLFTSRKPLSSLGYALPDLVSRLRATQAVSLAPPDETLLRQLLTKLLADRQLVVDRSVIDFIVLRMERSFDAANRLAAALDSRALASNRAITRRLASEVLDDLAASGP